MLFATPGQAVLVAQDRKSRIALVVRPPDLKADATAKVLDTVLRPMPPDMRRTVPFDNGTQFARHHRLTAQLGIETCFCDVRNPWQKDGVENASGRFRRLPPRKTNLDAVSNQQLDRLVHRYDNAPRQCRDFQTPAEAFQPVHSKCEPTTGSNPD